MSEVTVNKISEGSTIVIAGELYTVVEKEHVKPGKGGAYLKTKVKKLSDGTIVRKSLRAQDKIEEAFIQDRKMQYLYNKASMYYFMDLETYEQYPADQDLVQQIKEFLKENIEVTGYFYKGKIVKLELPTFLELKVVDTQPGVKGNTAQGGSKPAELETGKEIQVPLFISKSDIVKVDTRSGEYVERVESRK